MGIFKKLRDDNAFNRDIHDEVGSDSQEKPNAASKKQTHVVILVHGIRTRARWQGRVGAILEEDDSIRTAKPQYGFFGVLRFFAPTDLFLQNPLDIIWDTYEAEKNKPGVEKISILAHSFGTYLVSKLLKEKDHIRLDKLLFCGSIVSTDFKWSKYSYKIGNPGNARKYIVNDASTKDVWPAVADALTRVYGSSGTFGFNRPSFIENREHEIKHSGYFSDDFAKKYWKPFFSDGTILDDVESDESISYFTSNLPYLIRSFLGLIVLAGLFIYF